MTQPQTQIEPSDSSTTPELLLAQIEPQDIEPFGDMFRQLLDRVTPLSHGTMSTDDVLRLVKEDKFQLWAVFVQGAEALTAMFVTQLMIYPSGLKVCEIILFAGKGIRDSVHLISDLESWARGNGCDRIHINGRRGWGRVMGSYGVTENYTVFSKHLGD